MDADKHMTRIFVSYRRDDSAYVAATINEKLEQCFGADSVFFDIDTIPLGTDFRRYISDAIGRCDILLVIMGDTWIRAVDDQGNRRLDDPADFVRLEIEAALKRDIPVIPVLVGEARTPSTTDLPPTLHDLAFRNAAEVRAGRDLQQHLTRLVKGIETLVQSRQSKKKQAARGSRGTGSGESLGVKTPRPSITKPLAPTRQGSARRTRWKRWLFCPLVFISFFIGGGFVGGLIDAATGNGPAALVGAVSTWIAGIVLTYVVWRRC